MSETSEDDRSIWARLEERMHFLRRDVDQVPDRIAHSEQTLGERIRYEIEQAFKLSDGRNEQKQTELEGRLKEHVSNQFVEFERRLDEKLKGDWKRQLPMYVAVGGIAIMVGVDRAWPLIRSIFFRA